MSKAAELAALIGSQSSLSNRNLIINGAMQVDQRNTTVTSGDYTCDRWYVAKSNFDQLVFAADQDTTSPSGFSNSLKINVTTAETALASDELFYIRYQIEGQDLQRLEYGTSSAKSVTLSFWVRSSLTGKYSVLFYAIDSTRSNLQSFNINTANTWEYKTITIDGDTGATIDNDNNAGYQLYITLAAGSNFHGTPHTGWGAYVATDDYAFSDQVDFSAQTGTFFLTGVQLEVGEQATPFEHRPFGDELKRCQRYYARHTGGSSGFSGMCAGVIYSSTAAFMAHTFITPMRALPSVGSDGLSDSAKLQVVRGGTASAVSALAAYGDTVNARIDCTVTGATTGQGAYLQPLTGYVDFDAEL